MFINNKLLEYPSYIKGKKKNEILNQYVFNMIYSKFINIALDMYTWRGLPDSFNKVFFEYQLITKGIACAVVDNDRGLIALGCNASGVKWSIYGYPSHIYGYGLNGYNKKYINYLDGGIVTDNMAVICKDNDMMSPLLHHIIYYTQKIADTLRTIEVAQSKLKVPYFVTCNQEQENSVKEILNEVNNNSDAVVASKNVLDNNFKVFTTNVDGSNIEALWNSKNRWENELYSILGIENATNLDKKERLLVDEVNNQENISNIYLALGLKCRKHFCENVKKVYGINIDVEINSNYLSNVESVVIEDVEKD